MKNKFDLTGKKALVTGGGSGIGEAIARILALHGAYVNVLDIDVHKGNQVSQSISDQGGQCKSIYCNVSDIESVKTSVQRAAEGDALDILINNAGIAQIGTVENTTIEDFNKVIGVNVCGVFNCLQQVIPYMKNKGGSIINLSSIVAHVGIPNRFAYTMSKGAVHGMTLSVAKDYLEYNIRCNSIAPARVHTPFVDGYLAKNYPGQEAEMFKKLSKTQPIGRMANSEEIANLVLYLSSDEASFITGSCFPIDGGFITLNN